MESEITVSEVFGPVIQGEGHLAGRVTVFVRTGGCDFRCSWCDSMHAVDATRYGEEWRKVSTDDLLDSILNLTRGCPMLVTLSGGNPALQPFSDLLAQGHTHGFTFAAETQGTRPAEWFSALDHLVLSPKGPSSGMPHNPDYLLPRLGACLEAAGRGPETVFKVVVFDEDDYLFARSLYDIYGHAYPFHLQAGTMLQSSDVDDLRRSIARTFSWLVERARSDRWFGPRFGLQLHTMIWGDIRGV